MSPLLAASLLASKQPFRAQHLYRTRDGGSIALAQPRCVHALLFIPINCSFNWVATSNNHTQTEHLEAETAAKSCFPVCISHPALPKRQMQRFQIPKSILLHMVDQTKETISQRSCSNGLFPFIAAARQLQCDQDQHFRTPSNTLTTSQKVAQSNDCDVRCVANCCDIVKILCKSLVTTTGTLTARSTPKTSCCFPVSSPALPMLQIQRFQVPTALTPHQCANQSPTRPITPILTYRDMI